MLTCRGAALAGLKVLAMNWTAPYRRALQAQHAVLASAGFSALGEDDSTVRYSDGAVLLRFVVERFDDTLQVWVDHLGVPDDVRSYRMDLVMRAVDGYPVAAFAADDDEGRSRLVALYVSYLLQQRGRLFGAVCPYDAVYQQWVRQQSQQLMAAWQAKG